ncbi:MAG: hypothetical protein CISAcid_13710 [uncultured Acidilobus sp. CIS]|nr:MAG: hypothetical protein CISAcid_13710 [uncultured Acidilobus sp. CIS]
MAHFRPREVDSSSSGHEAFSAAVTNVNRSSAVAIALEPLTTKCSPNSITLAGALALEYLMGLLAEPSVDLYYACRVLL